MAGFVEGRGGGREGEVGVWGLGFWGLSLMKQLN